MNKHSFKIGAVLWISEVQLFIMQVIVARAWLPPYSWQRNYISDLGNPDMSPLYGWMNLSFVALGVAIAGGGWIFTKCLVAEKTARLGMVLVGVGGVGTVLVGLIPENTAMSVHVAGAALPFLLGNVGLVILATSLKDAPRVFKFYTGATGVLALASLVLMLAHVYLGIGRGNMERLVGYPQIIWMITYGVYALKNNKPA